MGLTSSVGALLVTATLPARRATPRPRSSARHGGEGAAASSHSIFCCGTCWWISAATGPGTLCRGYRQPVLRQPASSDDWYAVRELLGEYLRLPDAWPSHQPPALLPTAMTRYVDTFPQPPCLPPTGTVFLSVRSTGQPSGLVVLTDLAQSQAHLVRLYVRPPERRTGIGRALVTEAIRLATAAPCRTLALDVLSTRRPAIGLYRSAGFRVTTSPDPNPDGLVFMVRDV